MRKCILRSWFTCIVCIILLGSMTMLSLGELVAAPQASTRRFSKGDALRLTIWQPWQSSDRNSDGFDASGDYLIDNRGMVFFPLIGEVRVTNHNTGTLATELTEKFGTYIQDPVIVVEPLIRVALLGAFRRPGTYLVQPNASFWELVALAGGPDDDSDLKKMFIERSGKAIKKNLLRGFENAFTLEELGIQTGDQILLPGRSSFTIRDAFEIIRFAINLLSLYFLIQKI